jgi:hypothetical protein
MVLDRARACMHGYEEELRRSHVDLSSVISHMDTYMVLLFGTLTLPLQPQKMVTTWPSHLFNYCFIVWNSDGI